MKAISRCAAQDSTSAVSLPDCFNYYEFNSNNKVAEVEAIGCTETRDDKSVTDEITIIKELTWHEVLDLANTGKDCTGNRNSGDCNSEQPQNGRLRLKGE